jgi:preprotein translocase subunit SecF
MNVEQEIAKIKERNLRVEADKAWETSWSRKLLIVVTTYVVACVTLYTIGVPNFYVSAIMPTIGFFLSTLSFGFLKKRWVDSYFK